MNEIITTNNTPVFTNKALQTATNKVFKLGETVRKCAYETAYIMAKVEATECYKDDGFKSVHDWAMKTFGFKKSASYSLLRIGKEYTQAITDGNGKIKGYGSNLFEESTEIGDDFTTTQIEKMLPGGHDLAVELVESGELAPDMTCKEIENVIKAHTAPEETEADETAEASEADETAEAVETETVIIAVLDKDGNPTKTRFEIPVDMLADVLKPFKM